MKSFTINDLPDFDRPRERLKKLGPAALSSQELITLILGKGVKGESVTITAQRLLNTFGNIQGIENASLEELIQIKGIGLAKAAGLKAVFELAKRNKENIGKKQTIKTASEAFNILHPLLSDKKQEHFFILCLNNKNQLIRTTHIFTGTINSSISHPREIFKEAIQALSSGIIMAHNHPSGETNPSDEDIQITSNLIQAGKLIGIPVLDHLIIAKNNFFSFKEKSLL